MNRRSLLQSLAAGLALSVGRKFWGAPAETDWRALLAESGFVEVETPHGALAVKLLAWDCTVEFPHVKFLDEGDINPAGQAWSWRA